MIDWFNNHVLPLLYVPFDWGLGWTGRFPPLVAVTIVGVVSGIASVLIQKYASNQVFLAQCDEDLKFLKRRLREAKEAGDDDGVRRVRGLTGKIAGKKTWAVLKPSLWTVPLILFICVWASSRLAYRPIRPGQEFTVAAHFEDQARGFAVLLPSDAFKPVSPPIAPLESSKCAIGVDESTSPHALWTLRAVREGVHRLTIRGNGGAMEVEIPVFSKGGYPPESKTILQRQTPTQDQLLLVEIKLIDSLPSAWWTLWLQWMGPYMVVALAVYLALRPLLGVH